MLRQVMAAVLTAAALTVTAPAATADEPTFGCSHLTVDADPSPDYTHYRGHVYGYAVHAEGGPVEIECHYQINGDWQPDATQWSFDGQGAAAGAGLVDFRVDATDTVYLIAVVTTTHGTQHRVYRANPAGVPQEAIDDLVDTLTGTAVATVCGTTRTIGALGFNVLGLVVIDKEGDVYLGGVRVLDCP